MPFLSNTPLVIAVDGPAASGKGLLGRNISKRLNCPYLDTGKLYRAVGYAILRDGSNLNNAELAAHYAENIDMDLLQNPEIETEEAGRAASIVSAIPAVRAALLTFQRNIADNPAGAILDGRDIGTVVCPNANIKFFITASLDARAYRRTKQLQSMGKRVTREAVLQDLQARDARDSSRSVAPMKPADDAIVVDTTDMTADMVLQFAMDKIDSYRQQIEW